MRARILLLTTLFFFGCTGSGQFTKIKQGVRNPSPAKTFKVVDIVSSRALAA